MVEILWKKGDNPNHKHTNTNHIAVYIKSTFVKLNTFKDQVTAPNQSMVAILWNKGHNPNKNITKQENHDILTLFAI